MGADPDEAMPVLAQRDDRHIRWDDGTQAAEFQGRCRSRPEACWLSKHRKAAVQKNRHIKISPLRANVKCKALTLSMQNGYVASWQV